MGEPGALARHGGEIVGREVELQAIDQLLDPVTPGPAAAGHGLSVLVLEGDAGIGKTTVWREGIARASSRGYRVLSCRGSPAETELSFAALGDLLAPLELQAFDALPSPQRRALDVALLRADAEGATPDPHAIGTGVVSLVSALATAANVLLAIDDVQWLDAPSERALTFALRRLEGTSVAALATQRLGQGSSSEDLFSTIPGERIRRIRLGPLSRGALYQILKDHLGNRLTRPLLGKIEHASAGNPFYALEIARGLDADGRPGYGEAFPAPADMRDLMSARLRRLPEHTRDQLLRVSALAQPTVALVDCAALAPAEEAGVALVRNDGRVEFTHPLFAGAVYAGASHERRRRVHGELAELVTDGEERARHLSLASEGADERVAHVLDGAADLARRRGAPEVAAELAEQAARRTPAYDVQLSHERLLRAGWHHFRAGDREQAKALGKEILAAGPAPSTRAQALQLLAEARMLEELGAAAPLLEEALACAARDAGLAAQLETSLALVFVALFDPASVEPHLDRAIELAEIVEDTALLAEATALRAVIRLVFGLGLDEEALERALALEDHDREVRFQLRPSFNVAQAYLFTGRIDLARDLLVDVRERIVARGEENDLSWVLAQLAGTSFMAGELEVAEEEADDALRVATLTGQELFRAFALMVRSHVRATRADSEGARADADEALAISERIGWPHGVNETRWTLAFLSLAEGDPQSAVATLEPVIAAVEAYGVYEYPIAMSIPDAIEALVATGDTDRAGRLTAALADWGRRFDRPWALALSGRSKALLAAAAGDLESAQSAAEQALVEHERLPFRFELGRSLFVLGQIQRRRRHEREARSSLEAAQATFDRVGAPSWSERAAVELRGVPIRRSAAEGLTPTEERVAELAAAGRTNREVAQALFISPKTVEAHLTRVYRKLGVRSRAELGASMAERRREVGQAKT